MMYWRKNQKQPTQPKNLLAEGAAVRNALIVAKNMMAKGAAIEDVIKITGLSAEEIEKLTKLSFAAISKVKHIQPELL